MKTALPLQHHPYFAAALRAMGTPVTAEPLHGGSPLNMIRRCGLRFATRGPVWDAQTPPDQRSHALRQSRLHLLNTETADPAIRQAGFRQTHTGGWVAEVLLDDRITQRLHPKWRATWRKAHTTGLTTRQDR